MRARLFAAAPWFGIALGLLLLVAETMSLTGHKGSDAVVFYEAVQRVLADPATLYHGRQGPGGAAQSLQGFLYPPPSIAMLLPFGLGSPDAGFAILSWSALGAAILAIWLCFGAMQDEGISDPPRKVQMALMLLVLASGPVFACRAGQVDTLILAICIGGTVLAYRRFPALGASVLAFGAWVKIYPVLLMLPLMLDPARRTRALAGFLGAGLIIPALAALVFPLSVWITFFRDMMPLMAERTIINIDNQSLVGDVVRLWVVDQNPLFSYDTVMVPGALRAGVIAAGLVIIGAMQWRVQRTGGSPLIVAAVAMAVVSLISPLGWGHSYAYVLPLFVMVASQAFAARHLAWLAAIGAAYVAILIPAHHQFSIAQASPALWHLLYSRYALATLVLLAAGWRFTGVREIACGDR